MSSDETTPIPISKLFEYKTDEQLLIEAGLDPTNTQGVEALRVLQLFKALAEVDNDPLPTNSSKESSPPE